MGERAVMEWWESEVDSHLPEFHRKGLAVEISIAGEVVYRHAVMQQASKYKKVDCVKGIFYWMIDNDIFDELDLATRTNLDGTTIKDIPF